MRRKNNPKVSERTIKANDRHPTDVTEGLWTTPPTSNSQPTPGMSSRTRTDHGYKMLAEKCLDFWRRHARQL